MPGLEALAVAGCTGAVTAALIIGAIRADLRWLKDIAKDHGTRLAAVEQRQRLR